MMNKLHSNNFSMAKLIAAGIVSGAITGLVSGNIYASTAANTTITNTVTVNFSDAASVAQTAVSDSVDLTVNLLPSAPIVSSPANIDPASEDTANNLVYIIIGTSNGEDTYTFSSADTRANMDADATFTTPSIALGGTTLAADFTTGDPTITVPFDGTSNASVNGITSGDTIIIAGAEYTVGTIDESVVTNNTVQIPVTLSSGTAADLSTGEIIGEQGTVTVVATTDSITAGASGTHTVSSTATSTADGAVLGTQVTATVITVRRPVIDVQKYVRNITTPVVGTGPLAIDGDTWYTNGVNGQPGDVMEYLIVVDNSDASAGSATDIVISDPIPQFTTFVTTAGTLRLDPASATATATGAFVDQTAAVDDGDAAEFDVSANGTVYVYAGTGGTDTAVGAGVGTGGTLTAGQFSRAIFQVTID